MDIKRSSKRQKRVGDITVKTITTTTETRFNLEERELESKHSSPPQSIIVSPTSTRTLENQFSELKEEIKEEKKITKITENKGKTGNIQPGEPTPKRRLTRAPPPSPVESKEDTFEFEGSQPEEKEEKQPSKKGRPRKSTGEEKKKSPPKKNTKKKSVKPTDTESLPKRVTRPRAASKKAGARIASVAAREAVDGTPSEEEAPLTPPSPPAPHRTPKKPTIARRLTPKQTSTPRKRKEPEPEPELEPEVGLEQEKEQPQEQQPQEQPQEQEPEVEAEAGTPAEQEAEPEAELEELQPEIKQEAIPETPPAPEEEAAEFLEPEPASEGSQEIPIQEAPIFPYPLTSSSPFRTMSTPRKRARTSHEQEKEDMEPEMKTPARKRGRPATVSSAPQTRPTRSRTHVSPDLGLGLFDPSISSGMDTFENGDEDEDARQMLEIVQRFRNRQSNSKRIIQATKRFSDLITTEMKTAFHEVAQDQKRHRAVSDKVIGLQHEFMQKTAENLSSMATAFGTQMKSLSNDFKKQNTILSNWQHEEQAPSLAPLHKLATTFQNGLSELNRELTARH